MIASGRVADLLVEIDDHRVERLGRRLSSPDASAIARPCSMSRAKSGFFRYLSSFRLLSLFLLPGSATYGRWAYSGSG